MVVKQIFVGNKKLFVDYCLTMLVSILCTQLVWQDVVNSLYLLPGVLAFGISSATRRGSSYLHSWISFSGYSVLANLGLSIFITAFYLNASAVAFIPYTLAVLLPIQAMFIISFKLSVRSEN
ncbi:hypothetical protein [Algibacillus agarilyticus]|uniref:hypothetical protein n=1 Tax=Algibacillus agarilyticus TaxID=2234133 RepID=UPI000DD05298|nr:hypothetical protein [Algibacillus agarilyticus]